jgi:hypothetical protein
MDIPSGPSQTLVGPGRWGICRRVWGGQVSDAFFFKDGWFAVDLGNRTRVAPTHYLLRQVRRAPGCPEADQLHA